jgi:hypothetical protein
MATCGEDLMDGCLSSWTKTRRDLGTRGPQFGQGVRANIVLPQYMMNFQAREFAFQLAHFLHISIHCLLVAIPFLVDLLNNKKRVAIYKQSLDP